MGIKKHLSFRDQQDIERAVEALSFAEAKQVLIDIAMRPSGQEWDADAFDDIILILRRAGIPIADLDEGEEAAT